RHPGCRWARFGDGGGTAPARCRGATPPWQSRPGAGALPTRRDRAHVGVSRSAFPGDGLAPPAPQAANQAERTDAREQERGRFRDGRGEEAVESAIGIAINAHDLTGEVDAVGIVE